MAMDALERERLRRKMALKMGSFAEGNPSVTCISAHFHEQPHPCDLCQETHTHEILVLKNRAGKKMVVAIECLKEMVRFKVVDVEELPRWLAKLTELKADAKRRRAELDLQRKEEVKRLEKKVIVRKRTPEPSL